ASTRCWPRSADAAMPRMALAVLALLLALGVAALPPAALAQGAPQPAPAAPQAAPTAPLAAPLAPQLAPAARPAQAAPVSAIRVQVPFAGAGVAMQARVYKPPGAGPFRLAVISHGTEELAGRRAQHVLPEYRAMVSLLVRLGYAVIVPQRPGHGAT